MKMHIVLVEPEIPPNTGNIARSCVMTATKLHLIEPLGFSLDEKNLRRSGLDYWKYLNLEVHSDFSTFKREYPAVRLIAFSTRGTGYYHSMAY
ncbi:MAG: TrmH family RNA methyltransferase, partial [Dethiobacteria bacterium]|nr:TrmH family RNA methyltransferase [Dethiobacteria bacterium]